MTPDQPPPKPRSRKMYMLWGVALTLLLALGLFCWLVVVPVIEVHRAAKWDVLTASTTTDLGRLRVVNFYLARSESRRLGGATRAVRLYLWLPSSIATRKKAARFMLWAGRPDAEERMIDIITRELNYPDPNGRIWAIQSVAEMHATHGIPADAPALLAGILKDEDPHVRQTAAEALEKIKTSQEEQKR